MDIPVTELWQFRQEKIVSELDGLCLTSGRDISSVLYPNWTGVISLRIKVAGA